MKRRKVKYSLSTGQTIKTPAALPLQCTMATNIDMVYGTSLIKEQKTTKKNTVEYYFSIPPDVQTDYSLSLLKHCNDGDIKPLLSFISS